MADGVAEVIEAEASSEDDASVEEGDGFLCVAGFVGDTSVGSRGDSGGVSAVSWVEAYVDLIVVEVGACGEVRLDVADFVGVHGVGCILF